MNIVDKLDSIVDLIEETRDDLLKFEEKGNSLAGTRVRKAMQNVKEIAQDIRLGIQDIKNSEEK